MLPGLRAFAIPMPVKFRGITVREGALIEGPAGWGEFSPFAEYGPKESARWLASAIESAAREWPAPVRDRIPVNVTVPAVGPGLAGQIVARSGCRTAKVKVAERGQAEAEDIERVEAVREALGPDGKIRVDANGGWEPGQAARMLRRLARFGLEYAEQPCATLDELAELRRHIDIPVAADESIRRADDPLRVRAAGAADIVVLKVQPLGGVRAALRGGRGVRPSRRGLERGRHLGRARRRGGAGRRAPRAALCVRPGYHVAAGRRRHGRPAGAGCRRAAGPPPSRGRRPLCPLGDRPGAVAGPGGRRSPVPPGLTASAGASSVNPSTAFGLAFGDELARCGLREVVLAPGSRSTPLAMAFCDLEHHGLLRLHVRIDERSASFTALGLAKASRRPVAVLCTSGTAAANFHPAVIEADESGVPLLVLTADRPPELRGTGANQAIDQIKLYGSAVRWFCEVGVPEGAWGRSRTGARWPARPGGTPRPGGRLRRAGSPQPGLPRAARLAADAGEHDWPEPLDGRPGGVPWTRFEPPGPPRDTSSCPGPNAGSWSAATATMTRRHWWRWPGRPAGRCSRSRRRRPGAAPTRCPPTSTCSRRRNSWLRTARPDGVGRPARTFPAAVRPPGRRAGRHVVIGQGPGRWADPQRAATDVAAGVRLTAARRTGTTPWLEGWRRADDAARRAVDAVLDSGDRLTEPGWPGTSPGLPEDALLWAASSMPVRDIDFHLRAAPMSVSWPTGGPAASTGRYRRPSGPRWRTAARRSL